MSTMQPTKPMTRVPETVYLERWRHRSGPIRESYKVDGVAFIYAPDDTFKAQFDARSGKQFRRENWPVGATFTVRLMAHNIEERYDETLTFEVTGNPDDGGTFWTGMERAATDHKRRYEFMYGLYLDGAVLRSRVVHVHPDLTDSAEAV